MLDKAIGNIFHHALGKKFKEEFTSPQNMHKEQSAVEASLEYHRVQPDQQLYQQLRLIYLQQKPMKRKEPHKICKMTAFWTLCRKCITSCPDQRQQYTVKLVKLLKIKNIRTRMHVSIARHIFIEYEIFTRDIQ